MNQASVSTPTDVLSVVHQLLSAARQGIVLFNDRGDIAYASPLAIELLKINEDNNGGKITAELTSVEGQPIASLVSAASNAPILIMARRSGERFERVIKIVSGSADGVLLQDVTDEIRRDGGERAYLDVVAHDLRAGLVPIKTYAQMLQSGILGPVSEKQADSLRSIDICVERQVEKIGSVLDTIKAEENRLELTREPMNVADIVQKSLSGFDRDIKRRNVRIVTSVQGSTVAEADALRLQRTLSTLLGRSIRSSPQNGAVGVELAHVGDFIRLRLWDHAGPLSAEDLSILRSTVQQQSEQRVRTGAKPNMDLAPIHDILRAHGGRIAVHSDEGGTTCLLYLPACRKSPPEIRPAPRRALIVCGDSRELEALRTALTAESFQVFTASSAREASMQVRESYIPLLFISESLEGADIWKVQASIREQRPEEPHAACMLLHDVEQAQRPSSDGSTWLLNPANATRDVPSVLREICQRLRVEEPGTSASPSAPTPPGSRT